MIELGKIADSEWPLRISDSASNLHILITGMSGNGKSTATSHIGKTICGKGNKVIFLNVNDTCENALVDMEAFYVIKVKANGIPLSLLECQRLSDGKAEEPEDVSDAIVEIFSQADRMGSKQKYLLRKACIRAFLFRKGCEDDMRCLRKAINSLENGSGDTLMAKYDTLLNRVKFNAKTDMWRTGKVTVMDFSGYQQGIQFLLAQIVLFILWRQQRFLGQQKRERIWVVADEFQNFSLRDDSVLGQILREGRKFGFSLILATQTLAFFDKKQRAILQQPATKLYFRPVEEELRRIAREFPDINPEKAKILLQGLQIGECLASGEFAFGDEKLYRTLKISFPKTFT
jgi:DNA phosphorothioation-dependent restriction protein DptH